jgi:hypothetical protein
MTVAAIITVLTFLFFSLRNFANGGLFLDEAGDFCCCSRPLKVMDKEASGGATHEG